MTHHCLRLFASSQSYLGRAWRRRDADYVTSRTHLRHTAIMLSSTPHTSVSCVLRLVVDRPCSSVNLLVALPLFPSSLFRTNHRLYTSTPIMYPTSALTSMHASSSLSLSLSVCNLAARINRRDSENSKVIQLNLFWSRLKIAGACSWRGMRMKRVKAQSVQMLISKCAGTLETGGHGEVLTLRRRHLMQAAILISRVLHMGVIDVA
jgi:hypothetical protein